MLDIVKILIIIACYWKCWQSKSKSVPICYEYNIKYSDELMNLCKFTIPTSRSVGTIGYGMFDLDENGAH